MGYYSDIRLIVTKRGYELIKEHESNEESNILGDVEINKEVGDIVYLGWNNEKGLELREELEEAMNVLGDMDLSYRLTIIGDNLDDIEENSYTSSKDDFIPYPSLTRQFDEDGMQQQLDLYLRDFNKKNEIEVELDYDD